MVVSFAESTFSVTASDRDLCELSWYDCMSAGFSVETAGGGVFSRRDLSTLLVSSRPSDFIRRCKWDGLNLPPLLAVNVPLGRLGGSD